MIRRIALTCLLMAMLISAFSFAEGTDIDALLGSLTVREKVGQLFCVRPDAIMVSSSHNSANPNGMKVLDDAAREQLRQYPVGGFTFFAQNISSPGQVQALMEDLSSVTKIPPFFSVDEEGGSVARIANSGEYALPKTGSMGSVGRSGDAQNAREAGKTIGTYLYELGFTLNFAPVADVNTNPNNTVIGSRAFGSDPEKVSEMVASVVEGFHDAGIACTLKHFPGHGDTRGDTHEGSVSTYKSWEEMLECEIIPFRAGIEAGADAVMLAHIRTPNATSDGMPASLSPEMVTGHLRGELGFDGLIITDSLSMGAITSEYESDVAAMAALYAGADVLLMPRSLTYAFDMMVWAIEKDILPISRVDESVRRILLFKQKYGLI